MKLRIGVTLLTALSLIAVAGCDKPKSAASASSELKTIGIAFDTLQTEYWVASMDNMKAALAKRNIEAVPQVADGDANRQLEQVQNLIAQKVGGIVIAPKDGQTVLTMIKTANRANVPIVLYNRPPAEDTGKYVTIVADNYAITKATVQYMCEQAKKSGKKYKAMILIGDLGDLNAVGRRDGFADTVKQYADVVQVVSEVPTEWSQEKARAGVTNALQAHSDINFIFSSSDFLFPSVVAALKAADKYKKVGEEGHVLLGGFDGDATAYQMLADGYLDADGVQDMEFECAQAVQAVQDLHAGKQVLKTIPDPGLVVTHDNLKETSARMWGANVKKSTALAR